MIDVADLGDEIATLAAKLSAGTHQLLTRIRQFDEAEGWFRQGAQSCAHWLTWRIGVDPATAREKVRVARALGTLPRIDEAFASGRLSYAQVRAVTRVANAENEENVLMIAQAATGAQLERICRRFRTAKAAILGRQDEEAAQDRRIRARTVGDGLVKLEIVVSADEADLILKAVERARDELRRERPTAEEEVSANEAGDHHHDKGASAETSERVSTEAPVQAPSPSPVSKEAPVQAPSPSPRLRRGEGRGEGPPGRSTQIPPSATAADALVHLATAFLAGGSTSSTETGGDRYQVIVHLERDLLRAGEGVAASMDDGTAVSAETFRRIACEAGLVAAHLDPEHAGHAGTAASNDVLDIGRRTRVIPTAIRRALWLRDRGCRVPGCANHRFLHGHHIQHWLHGGATSLANLILLCPFHHRQVHEAGFTLRLTTDGQLEVHTPAHARLPSVPTPLKLAAPDDIVVWLDDWAAQARATIDAWTATSSYDGEPVDYEASVEALMVGM